jgi:hypothetical protein
MEVFDKKKERFHISFLIICEVSDCSYADNFGSVDSNFIGYY